MRRFVCALLLVGPVLVAACRPLPPNRDPRPPADTRTPPPVDATRDGAGDVPNSQEVEELQALGPSYIPYDTSPETVWDTETQAMLTRTLTPVLREEGLPARTRARYWILIREDGTVAEVVLQTSSENDAFDAAAGEVAKRLRFLPALRQERPVPGWVVREISMLMQ